MAYSSDAAQPTRGFIPPRSEDEKRLMKRVQELCEAATARNMPRYTGFLSDREQALAQAALNRCGCTCGRFWGGFDDAERKILCIEPPTAWQEEQVAILSVNAFAAAADSFTHRDLLGAMLGLGLERSCIGDLLLNGDGTQAYAVVLENKADFISGELTSAGRCTVSAARCNALPPEATARTQPELQQATVPSLRADTVLAAMMHTSRSIASQAISGGRVEINHVPLRAGHEQVYAQDVFTVRGVGRYRLQAIGGKSKKERIFVIFYEY